MPKRCSCLSSPSKSSHTTHLELTWQICLKCRNLQHHRPRWHANLTSHSMSQQVLPIWGPCTAWPVPPPVATCEWDSCKTCDPHGENAIPTCLYHHRLLEDKRWEENPKNIEEKGANQQQTTDLVRVGEKTMSNFEKLKQLGNTGSWASWFIHSFQNMEQWTQMNNMNNEHRFHGNSALRFGKRTLLCKVKRKAIAMMSWNSQPRDFSHETCREKVCFIGTSTFQVSSTIGWYWMSLASLWSTLRFPPTESLFRQIRKLIARTWAIRVFTCFALRHSVTLALQTSTETLRSLRTQCSRKRHQSSYAPSRGQLCFRSSKWLLPGPLEKTHVWKKNKYK